ncbi:MAG: MBL fold metallo-hydrolase [Sphingobium sp.]
MTRLLIAALLIPACSGGHAITAVKDAPLQSPAPQSTDDRTPIIKVVVLGSGNPVPSRTQAGTAILVEAGGDRFLFDCGRGCTTRLAQHDPRLVSSIDKIFLTHLHSDHVVGIPDLWLNGWTQGRGTPLSVWGPTGTGAMMEGLRAAYSADISYRLPTGTTDPAALTREIHLISENGVVYDRKGVKITAFRVHHADIPAYGYRIDYGGKSVLLSGDTSVAPNLARYGQGTDIALLEVASPPMVDYVQRSFPPEQADKILALHLTADQAAETFAAMSPRLGIYYHTVSNCAADKALMAMTRESYSGPLTIARDLTVIEVTQDGIHIDEPGAPEECSAE